MIDTKKVQLMTRITRYEKAQGSSDIKANHYGKKSYLALKLLNTWISTTIVCTITGILYASYLVMSIVNREYRVEYALIAKHTALVYLLLMVAVTVWALFTYGKRFDKIQQNIKKYEKDLSDLQALITPEEKIILIGEAELPMELISEAMKE